MFTIKTHIGESENSLVRAFDRFIEKCKCPSLKVEWLKKFDEKVKEKYIKNHLVRIVQFPKMNEDGSWPDNEQTFVESYLNTRRLTRNELENGAYSKNDVVYVTSLNNYVVLKNKVHYAFRVKTNGRVYIFTENEGWIDITEYFEESKSKICKGNTTILIDKVIDSKLEKEIKLQIKLNDFFSKNIFRIYKFFHTLDSIYLCLRFPFLYPRNRCSNQHYTNWKIITYCDELNEKYKTDATDIKSKLVNHIMIFWSKVVMWFHDYILAIIFGIPTYSEIDSLDSGWMRAFGMDLLKELKAQLKKDNYLYKYRIVDIKEKYGSLCWYSALSPKGEMEIISKYEKLSEHTCIYCGRPAKYITTGYILPYCEKCISEEGKIGAYVLDETGKVIYDPYDDSLNSTNQ